MVPDYSRVFSRSQRPETFFQRLSHRASESRDLTENLSHLFRAMMGVNYLINSRCRCTSERVRRPGSQKTYVLGGLRAQLTLIAIKQPLSSSELVGVVPGSPDP
jgi:hypothetical protein